MTLGTRELIANALDAAVRALGVEGDLPDLELGRAKGPDRGDYASPAGLKLAKALREAPPTIAARLASTIAIPHGAATVEAAGGYVNFRLSTEWLQRLVADVAANASGSISYLARHITPASLNPNSRAPLLVRSTNRA